MEFSFLQLLEWLGSITFAISGAMAAIRKGYDLVGLLILSFVTAIGGGTIRDLLIGVGPVTWLTEKDTNVIILAGAALSALFFSHIRRLTRWLNIFDAIGLGMFTILGINKGLEAQLPVPICVALGAITGTFGGVLRDVLTAEQPLLFKPGEIYATASVTGGILYVAGLHLKLPAYWVQGTAVVTIVVLRLVSLRYNWHLPRIAPKD